MYNGNRNVLYNLKINQSKEKVQAIRLTEKVIVISMAYMDR